MTLIGSGTRLVIGDYAKTNLHDQFVTDVGNVVDCFYIGFFIG